MVLEGSLVVTGGEFSVQSPFGTSLRFLSPALRAGVVFLWLVFMRLQPPSVLCGLPGRPSRVFDFQALGACAMCCIA